MLIGVVLALIQPGSAQPPAPPVPLFGADSTEALAGNLRNYLVEHVPPVLYEDNKAWGRQKQKNHKNHGIWQRVKVTAPNLKQSLVLELRDVQKPAPNRMTFIALVAFDARVDYERQNWRAGVRLYSGSVRARLRVKTVLRCEITTRLETPPGALVPDLVFRGRVLQADLSYDHFVVEHVAGVGGDLAKLLGNSAREGLHTLRPSLERRLLARGNAALVKAGDTKEVRLSLARLFAK